MIYCGIDGSSSCTGICIFEDKNLVYYDKIKPDKKIDFRNNTSQIIKKVIDIVEKYKPDIIYMEDIPLYATKNGLKPLIYLGGVQALFYYELSFNRGYNIEYIDVWKWRQDLDMLKGERKRDKQKAKSVDFVNKNFGLDLKYIEGKSSVHDDDDIAESICLCWVNIKDK